MNNFNLNLFKYFYYVVSCNGFTNASNVLHVSQSSLSYSVKKLEEELDKKLINRGSKTFELTEEGDRLFDDLKTIFNALQYSMDNFSGSDSSYQELSIGIRHNLSDDFILNSIKDFKVNHKNTKINVFIYSKLDPVKINNEYDIVIDYDYYVDLLQNVNKEFLVEFENTFVCSKNTYENYKSVNSIKQLDGEAFISYCPSRKKGILENFCYENKMSFRDIFNVNDSLLYKKLILSDFGIGLVSKDSYKLYKDSLFEISIKEPIFKDRIFVAFKSGFKNELVFSFIEILKNKLKGGQ